MSITTRRFVLAALLFAFAPSFPALAGPEKKLVGTYRLVERVPAGGGARLSPPEVVGSLTITKSRRTIIMKWIGADGRPVSFSQILGYTVSNGQYCETAEYGVQDNLPGPGVAYDPPGPAPACSAVISDATGVSLQIPGENVRMQFTRDGMISTTAKWTDHWERVK